jgi:hypothetical protein
LPESGDIDAWARETLEPGRVDLHPIVRLTDDGIDWGAEPGPGDEIGYCMNPNPLRTDTCFQAAIATVTQIPIEEVPDLNIDRRLKEGADPDELNRMGWDRIDRWAAKRGLTPRLWEQVPVPRRRWIGVVVIEASRFARGHDEPVFDDHCLIMSFDRLIFDPMCSVTPPPGMRLMDFRPTDITYGITFDREEN